jgi:hypothetical protein
VNTILPCAQALLYTIQGLMPSPYQVLSLKAIFAMFWEPQRVALPEQCVIKSAAALSRFLGDKHPLDRYVIETEVAKVKVNFMAIKSNISIN